jgi:hypothetical protein
MKWRSMITMRLALLVAASSALTLPANAQPFNQPPPAGPVVLDLNGTTIPHGYQSYSVNFIASSATTNISFAFREDPAFLLLENVSVVPFFGGSNLLVNGNFELGVVGSSTPLGWTYLNNFGATSGGVVQSGCGVGSSNCYFDGAVQAYDSITQAITTTLGAQYTIAFLLSDNGGLTTFSALSTNGDISDQGGNGANLLVYAGDSIPLPSNGETPLPGALPLFGSVLAGAAFLARRRKRKAQTA